MATRSSGNEIEIDQDLTFQRRQWTAQRFGWGVLTLLLLAAAAGLFGGGPLSKASAGDPQAFGVEYERFVRHNSSEELRLTIGPAAVREGRVRVSIDRDYLAAVQLETVVPEPERVEATPRELVYTFNAHATGPVEVHVRFRPDRIGWHSSTLRLEGGPELALRQLTYP